ncbi:MAG: methyl-accepting chemotaxis protein [Spirochaetaceae bacterium]|nr:methyl-accepting chemotaxis protein [Spirochaetaceae bacterium]
MRLKAKFSMLVFSLGVATVGLAIFLLVNFSTVTGILQYQNILFKNRFDYENIIAFTDRINSRGIDMYTLENDWGKRLRAVSESFDFLEKNKYRSSMNDEINDTINSIVGLWKSLVPQMEALSEHYKNISQMPLSSMFKNTVLQSGFNRAIENYRDYEDVSALEMELMLASNRVSTINYAYENFDLLFNKLIENITILVENSNRNFNILAIGVSLLVSILICSFVFILITKLIKRINNLYSITNNLCDKDLTAQMPDETTDEVGELIRGINKTLVTLNEFFMEAKSTADEARKTGQTINGAASITASASYEISSNVQNLKGQFENLEEAVIRSLRSLERMTELSSKLIDDNGKQTSLLRASNHAIAEIAKTIESINVEAIQKTSSAQEIQYLLADGDDKMNSASNLLSDITNQLDEIGEIIVIINNIADQTNILSMNAAIESAHAGESGKGFGVVAEEIRVLAESTAENAKRISTAIYGIVSKAREANESNVAAAEAFSRVSEHAKDMMYSLRDISDGIHSVDEKTRQISAQTKDIETSSAKMNDYCERLSRQQEIVRNEMDDMQTIFSKSLDGVNKINVGTADIAAKMVEVSSLSSASWDEMTKLGTALEEFKTTDELDDEFDGDYTKIIEIDEENSEETTSQEEEVVEEIKE